MGRDITVILPCAGEGTRLGLDSHKELYEIVPGTRLIDFSLAHIQAAPYPGNVKVAVVIRPWKTGVAEYVRNRLPGLDVEAVMFNAQYHEWPGSVFSASGAFSSNNLVLLPDSCLRLRDGSPLEDGTQTLFNENRKGLIEMALEVLEKQHALFGAVPCDDTGRLKRLGAMRVEENRVTRFQDKPGEELNQFNSFWGCYGFRGNCGDDVYRFLVSSVRHEKVPLEKQSFYPPGTFPLHSYWDLGTWESIHAFRGEFCS